MTRASARASRGRDPWEGGTRPRAGPRPEDGLCRERVGRLVARLERDRVYQLGVQLAGAFHVSAEVPPDDLAELGADPVGGDADHAHGADRQQRQQERVVPAVALELRAGPCQKARRRRPGRSRRPSRRRCSGTRPRARASSRRSPCARFAPVCRRRRPAASSPRPRPRNAPRSRLATGGCNRASRRGSPPPRLLSRPAVSSTECAVSFVPEPAITGTVTAPATAAQSSARSESVSVGPSPVVPVTTSPSLPSSVRWRARVTAPSMSRRPSASKGVAMAVTTAPKRPAGRAGAHRGPGLIVVPASSRKSYQCGAVGRRGNAASRPSPKKRDRRGRAQSPSSSPSPTVRPSSSDTRRTARSTPGM